MGAKQSKRSVDISGKEAEGAGEVAAAGAGGEGRVEPLADADALKPQLNGDAHIHEQTVTSIVYFAHSNTFVAGLSIDLFSGAIIICKHYLAGQILNVGYWYNMRSPLRYTLWI